jgi:hypothetical protein
MIFKMKSKIEKRKTCCSGPRHLFLAFAATVFICAGCHQSPKADQITYSEDGVEKVESAMADYDWSEFEP